MMRAALPATWPSATMRPSRMPTSPPRPGAPVFHFHCVDARAALAFEKAV